MPVLAVVLVSALLVAVVAIAVYLASGGETRRVDWEEQARVIFWDEEAPEGRGPAR